MKRVVFRLAVVLACAAAVTGVAAAPAAAGVYGVYPSAEACHQAGRQYTGVLWNHYSCYPVTGGYALWAAGW